MELTGGDSVAYKIAVASSDGQQIDETFGSAKRFTIYEVTGDTCEKLEERVFHQENTEKASENLQGRCNPAGGCNPTGGCATHGERGCGGTGAASEKLSLVLDCRCIVCKKIGFQIQKQLERKAISAFDVSCSVEEALSKISCYFNRVDNHESLGRRRS